MPASLAPVIGVDESACVNCHACISACPVKYCIDGSGDKISINHDLCIGCGRCITACRHHARFPLDDSDASFGADFKRRYADRSGLTRLAKPGKEELAKLFASMGKRSEADVLDCSSCG